MTIEISSADVGLKHYPEPQAHFGQRKGTLYFLELLLTQAVGSRDTSFQRVSISQTSYVLVSQH